MKLIEGMKHLRLLEKRMVSNYQRVNQYAAMISNERLYFDDDKAQSKEIQGLIQANMDLVTEYLKIKRHIDLTNLQTVIDFEGKRYTIADLIVLKRKLQPFITTTYESLNDTNAMGRIRTMQRTGDVPLTVLRFYSENEKHENLRKWQDMFHSIDSRLEVVNATTELITEE